MELVPHVYTSPLLRSIILGWFKPFLKFENHAMVSESQTPAKFTLTLTAAMTLTSSSLLARGNQNPRRASLHVCKHLKTLACKTQCHKCDNIYHATPVSMLIMNDSELNQTSLSLNACDLCVLCLSTFSRSNSRLQLLPSPFDKNFRIAFSILPSPAFCLSQTSAAEHGNTWQYLRYNMLQNLPHLCRQWTRRQLLQPPLMSHHYRTVLPSAEGLTSPELQNAVHRKYAMSKMRDSGGPLL